MSSVKNYYGNCCAQRGIVLVLKQIQYSQLQASWPPQKPSFFIHDILFQYQIRGMLRAVQIQCAKKFPFLPIPCGLDKEQKICFCILKTIEVESVKNICFNLVSRLLFHLINLVFHHIGSTVYISILTFERLQYIFQPQFI